MSIRLTITSEIEHVAAEQKKTIGLLNDNVVLLDLGLDSLCFAILVARLEDKLGLDPFTSAEEIYFPTTLGDFIKFYEDAA
jgi:acyl carrier protein